MPDNLVLHEVATPLQIDVSDWGVPHAVNDLTYREYRRFLRSYDRMAWQYHDCSWCKEPISPGDWYEAHVYVCHPGKCIPGQKKRRRLEVEKHHYPLCPGELEDREAEMRREWAREDAEKRKAERKAA